MYAKFITLSDGHQSSSPSRAAVLRPQRDDVRLVPHDLKLEELRLLPVGGDDGPGALAGQALRVLPAAEVLLDLVAELHQALLVRLQLLGAGQARLGARQEGPLKAHAAGARRGQLRRSVCGHDLIDGVDPSHEVLLVRGLQFNLRS